MEEPEEDQFEFKMNKEHMKERSNTGINTYHMMMEKQIIMYSIH